MQDSGLQTEPVPAWGYICLCNITMEGLGPRNPLSLGTMSKVVLVTFRWILSLEQYELI